MITKHFDAGIFGETPSSYLTAYLLSRLGYSVCLCEKSYEKEGPRSYPSFYPFIFYENGPFMETIRLAGKENEFRKFLSPLSIQIILPEGRTEFFPQKEKLQRELAWLFKKDTDKEIENISRISALNREISSAEMEIYSKKQSISKLIKLKIKRITLQQRNYEAQKWLTHYIYKVLGIGLPSSPSVHLYTSPLNGDAYTAGKMPASLIDFLSKKLCAEMPRINTEGATVDPSELAITASTKKFTFKTLIMDTMQARQFLSKEALDKCLKFFMPELIWFPVIAEIKREGLPVGTGNDLILFDPENAFENGNLLYFRIFKTGEHAELNIYSLWNLKIMETPDPIREIVGAVMDRVRDFMPFIDKHLIKVQHPQAAEEIPSCFFNYFYSIKKKPHLFKPLFRNRLDKNIFFVGPELFPHWGAEGEALSALEAVRSAEKILKKS
ncbi:MAG TPA: hypothetical protein VII00_05340 [bacterium]